MSLIKIGRLALDLGINVSSAKTDMSVMPNIFETKMAYNTGPKTEPCTVPSSRSKRIELYPSILT